MFIDKVRLYNLLDECGVRQLYHVNTVKTACTFINQKGLVSRGYVEDHGLNQTPQTSDEKDKAYGIWHDIFFDTVDIHKRIKGPNFYGPVMFVLSSSVILDEHFPEICITKENPSNWIEDQKEDERYFSSVEEYSIERMNNCFKKMIIFHNIISPILFDEYLEEIILDNPRFISNGYNYFIQSKSHIEECLEQNGFSSQLLRERACPNTCNCTTKYFEDRYRDFHFARNFV